MVAQDLNKAIVITILFTIIFGFFALPYAGGGDYFFHFEKAKNGCENLNAGCFIYTPLFHIIASPFTFHPNAFFYFTVFLIGFVTPMLLFLISKKWEIVWFYFAITSYFWFFIDGIFPQALAGILLLLILLIKDWKIQALIVLLSVFVHGHGFFLTAVTFLSIHLWEAIKKDVEDFSFKEKLQKIFLGCSGIFGNSRPETLDEPVGNLVSTGVEFKLGNILILFFKIFPIPYFYFSIKHLIKEKKDFHLLFITIISLIAGLLFSHRIFYVIPLVLLLALTDFYYNLNESHRKLFLISSLVMFGYQLYSWLNFKLVCSI